MLRRKPRFKNKRVTIPIEVPLDLYDVISIMDEETHSNPEEMAKVIHDFGIDGDWTLEIEYLKTLKKDIKIDYGKKAADLLQQLITIMETPTEE